MNIGRHWCVSCGIGRQTEERTWFCEGRCRLLSSVTVPAVARASPCRFLPFDVWDGMCMYVLVCSTADQNLAFRTHRMVSETKQECSEVKVLSTVSPCYSALWISLLLPWWRGQRCERLIIWVRIKKFMFWTVRLHVWLENKTKQKKETVKRSEQGFL